MKTNSKTTFFIATALIASAFLFTQCDSGDEFESTKKVKIKIDLGGELTQCLSSSLLVDENNPSNRYLRIDSTVVFGLGTEYLLPDSLKGNDLKIIVSGKMRNTESIKGSIACTLVNTKDSTLLWTEITSQTHVQHLNSWTTFKDSIMISKQQNNNTAKTFKFFPYKSNGKGTFDVDDLIVEIIKE